MIRELEGCCPANRSGHHLRVMGAKMVLRLRREAGNPDRELPRGNYVACKLCLQVNGPVS